jgi:structural maintenance of chromosome 1
LDEGGIENTVYLSNKGFKRIITLDGTKLSNGMFESGHQSNIFDKTLGGVKHDKLIRDKKVALGKAEDLLRNLLIEKGNYEELVKKAKSDMITKETQIRLMEENMAHVIKAQEERDKSVDEYKKEISELEEELKQLNTQRKDFNKKLNSLQKELNEIEQEEFADFLKKAKVDSLSEFEGVNMKKFEENARQKQIFKDNLMNIRSQIEKLGINELIRANEMLTAEEEEVKKTVERLEENIKTLTEELESKQSELESETKKANQFQRDREKDEVELKKDEESLGMLRHRTQELEKNMQEMKFTLKSKYTSFLKKLVLREIVSGKKAEKMMAKVDLNKPIEEVTESLQNLDVTYINLDFDPENTSEKQLKKYIEEKEFLLTEKEKAIEDYERVSMLAPECKKEIKQLSEKMKELKEIYEKEGEEGKSSADKLKELKKNRSETMNELIRLLNDHLSPIYQSLTKKDEYIFGAAHLMIEDKMNPFDGSINFIPNPPGKRSIYDIQQLSSGEKTMAVMSFVFALIQH